MMGVEVYTSNESPFPQNSQVSFVATSLLYLPSTPLLIPCSFQISDWHFSHLKDPDPRKRHFHASPSHYDLPCSEHVCNVEVSIWFSSGCIGFSFIESGAWLSKHQYVVLVNDSWWQGRLYVRGRDRQEIYRHWVPVMAGGYRFPEAVGLLPVWWPKHSPQTRSIGHHLGIRIHSLTRSPGNVDACESLRCTGLKELGPAGFICCSINPLRFIYQKI